jgi:hypothetical protein
MTRYKLIAALLLLGCRAGTPGTAAPEKTWHTPHDGMAFTHSESSAATLVYSVYDLEVGIAPEFVFAALLFQWRRCFWIPVLWHFLMNLAGILGI